MLSGAPSGSCDHLMCAWKAVSLSSLTLHVSVLATDNTTQGAILNKHVDFVNFIVKAVARPFLWLVLLY